MINLILFAIIILFYLVIPIIIGRLIKKRISAYEQVVKCPPHKWVEAENNESYKIMICFKCLKKPGDVQ